MRTACECRAYPDPDQQVMLARAFGRVRVVWNRRLAARQARAISHSGWGASRAMLTYKAERAGRVWVCPGCGARHDRDPDAARNILAAGRPRVAACGADVSHQGFPRVPSAVKQEPAQATERIPALQGRA